MTRDPSHHQEHENYDDTESFFATGTPRVTERHLRKVEDQQDLEVYRDADFDSNELTDGGNVCTHCHEVIQPGQYVRKTVSGDFQHEVCWHLAARRASAAGHAR